MKRFSLQIMILERSTAGEGVQLKRERVPATQTSYLFHDLKPGTRYVIGIIAFVDHKPQQVYKLDVKTAMEVRNN